MGVKNQCTDFLVDYDNKKPMNQENKLISFTLFWLCCPLIAGFDGNLSSIEENAEKEWSSEEKEDKETYSDQENYITYFGNSEVDNEKDINDEDKRGSLIYHQKGLSGQGIGRPLKRDEETEKNQMTYRQENRKEFIESIGLNLDTLTPLEDGENITDSDEESDQESDKESELLKRSQKEWGKKIAILCICTGTACSIILPSSKSKKKKEPNQQNRT